MRDLVSVVDWRRSLSTAPIEKFCAGLDFGLGTSVLLAYTKLEVQDGSFGVDLLIANEGTFSESLEPR